MLRPLTRLGLGLAFCGFGCTGVVDGEKTMTGKPGPTPPGNMDPSKPPMGGPETPPTLPPNAVPPSALPSDDATVPGMARVHRLTRLEYENTVRDLLGVSLSAMRLGSFSADQEAEKSGFLRGGSVTAPPDARVFMLAAEEIATAALGKMPSLLPCSPMPAGAAEQDACADKFLEGFGKRAYRRPLTDGELADLKALYRAQKAPAIGASFQQAIANVIGAMLQSPYFLYRWELGPHKATKDGDLVRFNHHEMASKLSYLFWSTMPDDKLFEAADGNKLGTADEVANQARRLLADPRAKGALTDFHMQWLGIVNLHDLQKDPTLTDFTPEMATAMLRETREFVSSVFQGPKADGKLETLLTSPASFVDGTLAKIYGVKNVSGADPQPVTYDTAQRAGILTQASFLTAKADAIDSHPIKRGDAVLSKLLCVHLEMPAGMMVPPLPEPKPGQTTRQRVAIHSEAACASCHKMIDPIGFAFENYDAIGRYRAMEENQSIDASGSFQLGTKTLTFKNAVELLPQLAKTEEVQNCQVTQWWRYTFRRMELDSEMPSMKLLREAFTKSGHDLRELLVAFTRTRAFSHRKPLPDEVLQ